MKGLLGILQAILALFSGGNQSPQLEINWYAALQDARIPDLLEANETEAASRIYAAITETTLEQGRQAIAQIAEQRSQWKA